jgi:hypothetical protein
MNTIAKPHIPSGFDKAFGTFPELPGAAAHWVAGALVAAWEGARVGAGRLFEPTVPIDGTASAADHPVLSFSVPRDAPPN